MKSIEVPYFSPNSFTRSTIPASTVYYPARLKAAGKQLALDLGLGRTAVAVAPMKMDRLTIVLTADAAG